MFKFCALWTVTFFKIYNEVIQGCVKPLKGYGDGKVLKVNAKFLGPSQIFLKQT